MGGAGSGTTAAPSSAFAVAPRVESELVLPTKAELAKAAKLWAMHTKESSIMQKMFSGQLQSSVVCARCHTRFTTYEPFCDLSLPLVREGKRLTGWLG